MSLAVNLKDGTVLRPKHSYPSIGKINPLPDFVLGPQELYDEVSTFTRYLMRSYGRPCVIAGETIEEWHEKVKPNKIRKVERGKCNGFLWFDPYEEMPVDIEVWVDEDLEARIWSFGFFHEGKCFHCASYCSSPSYQCRLEFIRYILASHDYRRWHAFEFTGPDYLFRITNSKKNDFCSLIARDSYLRDNTISIHTFIENEEIFNTDSMIPEYSAYSSGELPYRRFLFASEQIDEGFCKYAGYLDSRIKENEKELIFKKQKSENEKLIHDLLVEHKKEIEYATKRSLIFCGVILLVAYIVFEWV